MELHADLGYLYNKGFSYLEWTNHSNLKVYHKFLYVDYEKMNYGECTLDMTSIVDA